MTGARGDGMEVIEMSEYVIVREQRRPSKGRKLTAEKAAEIRRLYAKYEALPKELAIRYGVSKQTIYCILRGMLW